jgi:uncharacterized membrane protein
MATTTPDQVQQTTASPIDSHTAPTRDTARRSGKATAAFIVGIVSVLAALIPILGLILGITAAALGGVAQGETKANGKTNRWMAVAGLALGVLAIVASIGIFVAAMSSAS